jgi:hypothetical protein
MTDAPISNTDSPTSAGTRWQFSLLDLLRWVTVAAVCVSGLVWTKYDPIIVFIATLILVWWISRRLIDNGWTAAGFTVAVATNACSILAVLPLLVVPTGVAIRPMGLTVLVCGLATISLLVGVPLSLIGWYRSRGMHRLWGPVNIALNLAVLPSGLLLMNLIANIVGLTLEG